MVFFYGHGYGPLGLFFDAESGDAAVKTTMTLASLSESLQTVRERAAVVVFRACQANTLETAYQLRDAGEFMLASQSIVPIAGIWPWGSFLTSLMPERQSVDVARAIGRQLALFLETQANRGPFADVPYSLIDLGAARAIADPLKALADALGRGAPDAARRAACGAALEAARVGFPDDHAAPGDPALLDVPTMCENLAQLEPDPVAAPARALADVVDTPAGGVAPLTAGPASRDRSLLPAGESRRTPSGRTCTTPRWPQRDAEHYRQLALSQATGWDRIALDPLTMRTRRTRQCCPASR